MECQDVMVVRRPCICICNTIAYTTRPECWAAGLSSPRFRTPLRSAPLHVHTNIWENEFYALTERCNDAGGSQTLWTLWWPCNIRNWIITDTLFVLPSVSRINAHSHPIQYENQFHSIKCNEFRIDSLQLVIFLSFQIPQTLHISIKQWKKKS